MKKFSKCRKTEVEVMESVSVLETVLENGCVAHNGLERDQETNGLIRDEIETDEMAEMNVAGADSPDAEAEYEPQPCPMVWVSPERIVANPDQPRTRFTRADLRSLTQSVRQHGVLQPITVCQLPASRLPSSTTMENGNGEDSGDERDNGDNCC